MDVIWTISFKITAEIEVRNVLRAMGQRGNLRAVAGIGEFKSSYF